LSNLIIYYLAYVNLDDLLHASSSTNILKVLGDSDDKVNAADFSDSTIDKTVDGLFDFFCKQKITNI
jgi:hypothetical protein